jgi:hypothetical protein
LRVRAWHAPVFCMHQYWIPSHVRVCPLLASTILLDLERNRYFGIGANETRALSTLALNWHDANGSAAAVEQLPSDAAIAMADALIEAGLLSREPPADRTSFGAPPLDLSGVLSSAGHELSRAASLRLAHIASFLGALAWTRRALRSTGSKPSSWSACSGGCGRIPSQRATAACFIRWRSCDSWRAMASFRLG